MSGPGCLVAMYHYVRDVARTPFPRLNALGTADFDAQLDWLGGAHRVIAYDVFERALHARQRLEELTALLTFDDGFVDHHETVFARLVARGWSGVFFLAGSALDDPPHVLNVHKIHFLIEKLGASSFMDAVQRALDRRAVAVGAGLDRRPEVYRYDDRAADAAVKHLLNYELPYDVVDSVLGELFTHHFGDDTAFALSLYLSAAMIREMAASGMWFGFHTERHRVLSRLSPAEQRKELSGGVERVKSLTGQSSVPFCYPYGHPHTYDADTLMALAETGYAAAFNTERRRADTACDERFQIPRFDTRDLPPFVDIFVDV